MTAAPRVAAAATYYYVDWMTADVAGGTASGVITLPDNSTVTVTFAAINADNTPGNLFGAQTNGGTNYWVPSEPYISTQVENAPPDTDILQLAGGQNQTYKVTLSDAIKDPIMAIVSLGAPGVPTTYDFDSPFTIVSQGVGYWGGGPAALVQEPNNVLQGAEGHGTIQFIGTFSTFSWTVPTPETWHGFTFGIRTTERLEPPEAAPEVAPEVPPEEAPEATDGGLDQSDDASAEAAAPEPAVEPAPEAAVEPTAEPAVEPSPEPAVDPAPERAVEPAADGGTTRAGSGGGCGCTLGDGAAPGALSLLGLSLLFARRRRR